jgi:hypothetical protein
LNPRTLTPSIQKYDLSNTLTSSIYWANLALSD